MADLHHETFQNKAWKDLPFFPFRYFWPRRHSHFQIHGFKNALPIWLDLDMSFMQRVLAC
jgi:hypothetical protein